MATFNKATARTPRNVAPIVSTASPTERTGNQAPGFVRDAKGELFLLAVANFVGQSTFYERAEARDTRYAELIRTVAVADPDWMRRFLPWLRNDANMRAAAVMGAMEAAYAMKEHGIPGCRSVIANTLARADEPGEALAYAKNVMGRKVSAGVMRGIADAAVKLYNEYSTLKYDGTSSTRGFRFGDVVEICRPRPANLGQDELFKYLITRGKGSKRQDVRVPDNLTMINGNASLRRRAQADARVLLNPTQLKMAGFNWEDAMAYTGGSDVSKKEMWEALIPNMGYMALLRNLRNFDEAGVSNDVVQNVVIPKLVDPTQVERSRQLPMRFLSAYRAAGSSLRWGHALTTALDLSLRNVPEFTGRTLILVDTSGSMGDVFGKNTDLRRWDAAVVFGLAMARRCAQADVYSFSNNVMKFDLQPGAALLHEVLRWDKEGFFIGHGTDTWGSLRSTFRTQDRVVILTDEQADAHPARHIAAGVVPEAIPIVTFNLAGYRVGHMPSGTVNRITIGGLSDAAFKLIPALEKFNAGGWPF